MVKGVWILTYFLKACLIWSWTAWCLNFDAFPRAEQKVRELNEEQARKASEAEAKEEEKEKAEAGQ